MNWHLGLDISTSCTGLCLLAEDGSDMVLTYCALSSTPDAFGKAQKVKNEIIALSKDRRITRIFIEENLQSFRRGLSSAHTINMLARFNGVISYIAQDSLGVEPEFLNVTRARTDLSIPINKKIETAVKQQVFTWVRAQIPTFQWPLKKGRDGTQDNDFRDVSLDMSDAYVMARAGSLKTKAS
jgi:hypothetical protein